MIPEGGLEVVFFEVGLGELVGWVEDLAGVEVAFPVLGEEEVSFEEEFFERVFGGGAEVVVSGLVVPVGGGVLVFALALIVDHFFMPGGGHAGVLVG